jgi:enamine deaminase RidA (YjgF/YER057c/UK114 family)
MRLVVLSSAWLCLITLLPGAWAQKKDAKGKKEAKEEITQTLALLPDPPPTVVAPVANLVFHVAPLSAKGLLSKQVEDALKAINKQAKGGNIVKVRAFVAGTGDMRRVNSIVSEVFTKRKKPLPVVNIVRVGLLPLNGAQVALEGVSVSKKPVNPTGLVFISGQAAREPIDPADTRLRLAGVAAKSVDLLRAALSAHGLMANDVLRVTCFGSSLDDGDAVRLAVAGAFPTAALNLLQVRRAAAERMLECEAVARLRQKPADPWRLDNTANAAFARAVTVAPANLLFTSTQLAFGAEDADVRLAFTRLRNTLAGAGSSLDRVLFLTAYPPNNAMLEKFRRLRFEFLDRAKAPASTNLPFEGLPSLDATLGIDVIAAVN